MYKCTLELTFQPTQWKFDAKIVRVTPTRFARSIWGSVFRTILISNEIMSKNLGSSNFSSKTWMAMWDIVLYNNSLQSSINAWYLHEWSWGELDGWHLFSRTVLKRRSRSKFASHYTWGTNEVCEWKMDVMSTWLPTWHWMDHVSWSLGYFRKSPLRGRSNTKLGEHGIRNAHNCGFILFLSCARIRVNTKFIETTFGWGHGHIWLHTTLEGPWPHCMILEVSWHDLWTLSFGLSQFHGHGLRHVCEVALSSSRQ